MSSLNPEQDSLVRPLGKMEEMALQCYRRCGSLVTVYALQVRSSKQISDNHMHAALSILFRKLQHLRCCIIEKDSLLMFKEMQTEKIDFKRIITNDWKIVHEQLLSSTYDIENGPLWCCRLVEGQDLNTETNSEYENKLLEKYILSFAFMHSITDGTSDMYTMGHFIRILNNVISETVCTEQKLCILPNIDELIPLQEKKFRFSDLLPIIKEVWYFLIRRKSLFYEKYERPIGINPKTKTIYIIVDEEKTQTIIKRCKSENCTVHGALCIAAIFAMIRMMPEKVTKCKGIPFRLGHAVNIRKFVNRDKIDSFGACFVLMAHNWKLNQNLHIGFWEHCRHYTKYLHQDIDTGKMYQFKRIMEFCYSNPELIIENQSNPECKNCIYDFGTSNLGVVDNMLKGIEQNVEITDVCRSTSFHNMGSGFTHNLQTYRGRMHYTLDYFTNVVTENIAEEYSKNVIDFLVKKSNDDM